MAVLITGASGRIGRHLIPSLLRNNEKVRVLVNENMVKNENVEIFYGNVLDKTSLEKAMKDVDMIYHLAAVTDRSAPKEDLYKVNVLGTMNLIDAAKGRKIIYLSTTSVMGNRFKELPLNESIKCNPLDYYAKTKLEAEELVLKNNGLVIRSPDVFSAGFLRDYEAVFSSLERGDMPILGDGKNFIQWIDIEDLTQALVLAKNLGKPGQVYIVAGREFLTLKQMWSMLCNYLDVNPPEKYQSGIIAKAKAHTGLIKGMISKQRPDMLPFFVDKFTTNMTFDTSKAKSELGFEPKIIYKDSAKNLVEEYKNLHEKEHKVPEEISEKQA